MKEKPLVVAGNISKLKCPYCGYEWVPRIPNPKMCPFCKKYFLNVSKDLNTDKQ